MLETIETEITEFIANGVKERIESITPEDRLLEDGIIDSLSLLDLVTFIEKTYRVVVDDFDIDLETFGSVRSIAKYVSAKPPLPPDNSGLQGGCQRVWNTKLHLLR